MTHISISPTVGADKFNPLTKAYDRVTRAGSVPVVNFLLGSHYNVKHDGQMNVTSVGSIISDTFKAINGKIEIAAESSDGTIVEKIATFVAFMYFFPGVRVTGQSEIQDDNVGGGPVPVQRIRYEYEDLGTTDLIRVDFEGGDGNAVLKFSEVVDGSETVLVTQQITGGVKNVFWEIDFLEDGITKFHYKEPSGSKTRIFNGTLKANIAECKVSVRNILDQQFTKTLKSDFMWIFYPNVFVGYDIPNLANKAKGRVRVFDDNLFPADETKWVEVFSSDHKYIGQRVIENGMIRLHIKTTPEMEILGWDDTAQVYKTVGEIKPKSSQGDLSTTLHDVVFEIFNDAQAKMNVKYGIVDHIVDIKRGWPYIRIVMNSKEFRFNTKKQRFALSVDDTATQIQDFNQLKSDDANRGNPLNLSPTNNPFTFTNDNDVDTGLLLLDDNWFAWYNDNATDMVGWLGAGKRPTGLKVTATTSSELSHMEWSFDKDMILSIGILDSIPSVDINGVPTPFHIGSVDQYVKWRANESIMGFNQKMFLRTKR